MVWCGFGCKWLLKIGWSVKWQNKEALASGCNIRNSYQMKFSTVLPNVQQMEFSDPIGKSEVEITNQLFDLFWSNQIMIEASKLTLCVSLFNLVSTLLVRRPPFCFNS